jgi:hypothetical protein
MDGATVKTRSLAVATQDAQIIVGDECQFK